MIPMTISDLTDIAEKNLPEKEFKQWCFNTLLEVESMKPFPNYSKITDLVEQQYNPKKHD